MAMADRIEAYLTSHAQFGSTTIVSRQLQGNDLLLFGETHIKLTVKTQFFAEMIRAARRSQLFQYHASEHFRNDTATDGKEIEEYLEGKRTGSGLASHLREMVPVLDAARESLPAFGLVYAGTKAHDHRDRRIHAHFDSSRALHLKARRFPTSAKGQFHIGAEHAARVAIRGTEITTCGRLVADGFKVHVMRVTVDKSGSATVTAEGFAMDESEGILVTERGANRDEDIDLLPMLRKIANGKPIFVGLKESNSPFGNVLDSGGKALFGDRFDSILHLPG